VDLKPIKQYADLFETMIGAYWVQAGVTYEDVFQWIDATFRPLLYAAELDVRNDVESKTNEKARSKTDNRDANVASLMINTVRAVLAPEPRAPFRPIRALRPGPVTRSNAGRASAAAAAADCPQPQPQPQPPLMEEVVAVRQGSEPPPTKKIRYERTGPVLNLEYVFCLLDRG
jgi:hypothetical protein